MIKTTKRFAMEINVETGEISKVDLTDIEIIDEAPMIDPEPIIDEA